MYESSNRVCFFKKKSQLRSLSKKIVFGKPIPGFSTNLNTARRRTRVGQTQWPPLKRSSTVDDILRLFFLKSWDNFGPISCTMEIRDVWPLT